MKYSQDLVWQAVYEFVPGFKNIKEAGVHINLSSALQDAAVASFLISETIHMDTRLLYAANVIRTALKELNTVGYMTFGQTN